MDESVPRRCLACGATYAYHEDFLCGDCAVPGKTVVVCACGHRNRFPPKSTDCEVFADRLGLAIVAGMTIRVSGCPCCGYPSMKGPMTVFQIKEGNA
jgi:hypothetical protein